MKNRIGPGLSSLLKGHAYLCNSYPALVANLNSPVTHLLQMAVDISVSRRGAMTCRLYTEIMLPPPPPTCHCVQVQTFVLGLSIFSSKGSVIITTFSSCPSDPSSLHSHSLTS